MMSFGEQNDGYGIVSLQTTMIISVVSHAVPLSSAVLLYFFLRV